MTQVRIRARRAHAAQGRQLRARLKRFLTELELDQAEVSLRLVGDRAMRRLNREARGIDRTTDVLSFPAASVPGSPLLGDLVISVPVAKRWALKLRKPLSAELALYAAHGLLHLRGYDHQSSAGRKQMAELEHRLLGSAGLIERAGRGSAPRQGASVR